MVILWCTVNQSSRLRDLFILILVHAYTSVHYLIYATFSLLMLKCSWAHTLYHVCWCIALLLVLGLRIYCGVFSHANFGVAFIFCLFLFVKFLFRDILFVMPDLVVLLFRFKPLLLAIGMCFLPWWALYLYFHWFSNEVYSCQLKEYYVFREVLSRKVA
jgi:hypothetical protein